jgi:hypothetical protein
MTQSDFTSATWRRLEVHVLSRLAELRVMLEGNLSFEKTQELRAKISELKALLSLREGAVNRDLPELYEIEAPAGIPTR